MKLLRMTLENFKGIRQAEFDFGGHDANIYGANGTGKTTVFDAFTWLLFGKTSEERANFNPKTITNDGYVHNLNHSVECDVEVNGSVTTFKRVFHEVYKKIRGNAETVMSGHTTDYYINGTPKKEKEYLKYWENVFPDEETVKLLTMPYYFPEMLHWEKRRGILLEICGNISDAEIMETDDELINLEAMLGKQSVDEFKKTVKAQRTEINRKIEMLPARIDEANKAIPNISGLSEAEIDKQLTDLRREIWEAEKERAALLSGGTMQEQFRAQIAGYNADLAEAKEKYFANLNSANAGLRQMINEICNDLSTAEIGLEENQRILTQKKQFVADIELKRNEIFAAHRKMQEEYMAKQEEIFDESAALCDKCGQSLPAERVSDLHRNFNERKSNRLEELTLKMNALVEQGKNEVSKEKLAIATQEAADYEGLVENSERTVTELKVKRDEAQMQLRQSAPPPFEETKEYLDILSKINRAKEAEKQYEPDTSDIDGELTVLRETENELNNKKSAILTEKAQRKRISELEAEEKDLGKKYEEAEKALYLCEKFTRVKSALLNDKINEKFSTVRFRLFKQNITNDGIDDICDVLVPNDKGALVPFADANKAAKLNAALEIIGVLGEHYGIELPIFVDNAESVTHIIPTKGQLIRLVVSESDKVLRLETL